jgi:hypothetical protein
MTPYQQELMDTAELYANRLHELNLNTHISIAEKLEEQMLNAQAKLKALVMRAYCDECPLCGQWDCVGCDG